MTNIGKFFGTLKCSILHSPKNFQILGTLKCCSSQSKLPKNIDKSQIIKKEEEGRFLIYKDPRLSVVTSKYWNEKKAVKQLRKQNTFPSNISNIIDITNTLVSFRKTFPGTLKGLLFWIEKRIERRKLIEQKYLPKRVAILKPDMAAAHFLVSRGGSVRFVGQDHWVGIREKKSRLPNTYVPGYYIQEMSFEGSDIYYEGLKNICRLDYLKSLSLKNLEQVNDWWLDWISSEYYLNLEHLDLSGCKNVTYRGLSCFYRFENLKTLNVKEVSDTPEFKLACVMLQDIMPELEILGIDLSLLEEIKAVKVK